MTESFPAETPAGSFKSPVSPGIERSSTCFNVSDRFYVGSRNITDFERDGIRNSVLEVLKARFEAVPVELNAHLKTIDEATVLTQ